MVPLFYTLRSQIRQLRPLNTPSPVAQRGHAPVPEEQYEQRERQRPPALVPGT